MVELGTPGVETYTTLDSVDRHLIHISKFSQISHPPLPVANLPGRGPPPDLQLPEWLLYKFQAYNCVRRRDLCSRRLTAHAGATDTDTDFYVLDSHHQPKRVASLQE